GRSGGRRQMQRKYHSIVFFSAWVVLVVLVSCADAFAPARAPSSNPWAAFLSSCHPLGVDGPALCGKYEVFENRPARTGRKIGLKLIVLPASGNEHTSDPVFWLHGGPGAAATQAVAAAREGFLQALRGHRDLVFVDQRGTGESNGLRCDLGDDPSDPKTFFGDLFPLDLVKRCRTKLESAADLRLYTTPIAMDDLDEVRAALGYERINLVAASYGTIAALVYMRQHQDHLRAVFLAGVANTNIRLPLHFPGAAQRVLDLLFEDCAADSICHQHFPDLKPEFAAALKRLARRSLSSRLTKTSSTDSHAND